MPSKCEYLGHADMDRQPGDMWLANTPDPDVFRLCVMLPNGQTVDLDTLKDGGWQVTGEPPSVTVMPSILAHSTSASKGWHGYLRNGVLSDDLEGRKYDGT